MKEWAGSADEDADSDESDVATANVSHNPPVRRENKKTERERKRLKLMKAEERRVAKLKMEKMRQSNVLRSVVTMLYITQRCITCSRKLTYTANVVCLATSDYNC